MVSQEPFLVLEHEHPYDDDDDDDDDDDTNIHTRSGFVIARTN
jgi:hypothetical protein